MFKKSLAVIVAAILLTSSLASCSGGENALGGSSSSGADKESSTESSSGDTGETEEKYEFKLPLVDEKTEVTWATVENWYPNASYNDGLEIYNIVAEKTNISIKWEVLPDAQYLTSMQTRLAAASNLPDILRVPGGDPSQYGQQKILLPMNDLIDKYGYGVKEMFAKYPDAEKLMKSGDGNYYGIAPIIIESSRWMPRYMTIRKDWLENVGMESPVTTDEWLTVLKAFRDNDVNGNGDKSDEIPYAAEPEAFGGAFGLHLMYSNGGFFADDAGKVYYQYADPRMKELLTFMNTLYTEKLLDPDFGNPDAEARSAKITRDIVGSSYEHADLAMSYGSMIRETGNEKAWFVPATPPKGPSGEQTIEGYGTVDSGFQSISKDCKNPEAAFKLMDYFWTEEGRKMLAYGLEGKTYELDANGEMVYTKEAINNPDGISAALRTLGAWPTIPWVQQERTYVLQLEADKEWGKKAGEEFIHPYYIEPFPMLLASKDEQEQLAIPMEDISTWRKENVTKFIMGVRPISEFDAFVEELKGIGLEDVLAIKQAQYDNIMK